MTDAGFNQSIADHEIKMSATAAEQMKGLMANADDGIEGIRVFVTGGGCGGMTYGMTYADEIHPWDKVLEGDGFKLLADAIAVSYLKGCDIDFVENGLNASFVFNNVFQTVGGSGMCGGCGGGGCA
ncbi:MAG: iron-sulfur cluster assembly accessory protein [Gammaproteobacteria bacterium]|nr:iron-sulfur cluster assembly accessory protein [Gammaproteobacteria bacterium]MDH5651548.1 iron-sulfur cluster assembly accessory protein [Gammaproteobacteria bacterium]